MPKREFLMLAKVFNPDKHYVGGWYLSEKLDGQRCFWDGGVTRGMLASDVPWANTSRDGRYREPPVSTGLWSRYGNVIHCPDWFAEELPSYCLDGELYLGPGRFQEMRSIVSRLPENMLSWSDVKLHVIEVITPHQILKSGVINSTNYKKSWDWSDIKHLYISYWCGEAPFWSRVKINLESKVLKMVPQIQLPYRENEARGLIYDQLDHVTSVGGEGLMLRAPSSIWIPERSDNLLKVKPMLDAEATIVGFRVGRESDNTRTVSGEGKSKLLGSIGALVVSWNGIIFELGGLNDVERELESDSEDWAINHPGELLPSWGNAKNFTRGDIISFRYVSLTDSRIPREARYLCRRS